MKWEPSEKPSLNFIAELFITSCVLVKTRIVKSGKSTPLIVACQPTAAEACRRLDNYSMKKRRWRLWTEEQKNVARDLIRYNKDDCLGVFRLAKKIGSSRY